MKIILAGKDRTADIGRQAVAEAAAMKAKGGIGALSPEHTALTFKRAMGSDEFTRWFVSLLRIRHGVRTEDYFIPHGPGLRGKLALRLKLFLWRLLRYQRDRIAFQQNLINELTIMGLELQQKQMETRFAELKDRLDQMEKAGAKEESR